MADLLDDALAPEGLDAAAVARVRARLAEHDAFVAINYEARYAREREAATAAAAKAAAEMPDYHGAIARCQAQVTFPGRMTQWDRCTKRPTKVRRFHETVAKGYKGNGVLAVCSTHARAKHGVQRWVKGDHWTDKGRPPTADEPLEEEYLT